MATPTLQLDFARTKRLDPRITFTRLGTTGAATYFGADGLLKIAQNGEARFDHDPVTGESKGLLIEEARTNLATYSEDFRNTADAGGTRPWAYLACTITPNAVASPDGSATADRVVETSATSYHGLYSSITVSAGATLTFSCYVKAGERTWIGLEGYTGTTYPSVMFNLATGQIGTITGLATATMQPVGGGWYRCSITYTMVSGTATNAYPLLSANGVAGNLSYAGDPTKGLYVWGAQLEAGAFATSYIPTVASAVTRNADVASMTGANFSSWYNQTEGTFVCNTNQSGTYAGAYILSVDRGLGTFGPRLQLGWSSASAQNFAVVDDASALIASIAQTGWQTVLAYKTNDFAQSTNGVTAAVDSLGSVPTGIAALQIGASPTGGSKLNGHIASLKYFNTRLDNTTLQALSAPQSAIVPPSLQLNFAKSKALDPRITFTRATTGTYYGADGMLKIVQNGEARFDHDPVTGESKGLLIEEARTNLLLNSTIDGANLATQSITTTAAARTLSFYGTGQIVLSGTHSATVVGSGAYPTRTTYAYTPTAGTLTLTVTGTVQYAQDELGAFATTWIPTAGASATRNADIASMSGANFSSWYNQTEGTFSIRSAINVLSGNYPSPLSVNDGTANNGLGVFHNSVGGYRRYLYINAGAVIQANIDAGDPAFSAGVIGEQAFGYKANDFGYSRSGETPLTDTAGSIPAVDRLWIGCRVGGIYLNGHISRITYLPRRLDNTTLQGLSA